MKYEKKRFELFANSYVGYKLKKYLRNKYGYSRSNKEIPIVDYWISNFDKVSGFRPIIEDLRKKLEKTPKNLTLLEKYASMCNAIENEITEEISILAEYLRLDKGDLKFFISTQEINLYGDKSRLVFRKTSHNSINETGYYIKVEPNTSKLEMEEAYRWITRNIDLISSDYKLFKELPKRKQDRRSKQDLKFYTLIEKEMINIDREREKRSKPDYLEITKDGEYYNDSLVGLAIERVVGRVLEICDIKDDSIFTKIEQEGNSKLQELYYRIADEYKLPTPKKLKSILEHISY